MSSQNNFVWPQVGGIAEAPDWIANKELAMACTVGYSALAIIHAAAIWMERRAGLLSRLSRTPS